MIIFQIWYGDVPERNKQCMQTVKRLARPSDRYLFCNYESVPDPVNASDVLRFGFACDVDDILYVDCDIELDSFPYFPYDKPSFIDFKGQPDGSMFYSPYKEWFLDLEKERVRRGITQTYGWPRRILRGKDVHYIDDEIYTHHMYSYTDA